MGKPIRIHVIAKVYEKYGDGTALCGETIDDVKSNAGNATCKICLRIRDEASKTYESVSSGQSGETKYCPQCKRTLSVSEFKWIKKDERMYGWCKTCSKKNSSREYYKKKNDRMKALVHLNTVTKAVDALAAKMLMASEKVFEDELEVLLSASKRAKEEVLRPAGYTVINN